MEAWEKDLAAFRKENRDNFTRLEQILVGDPSDPDSKGGLAGRILMREWEAKQVEMRIGALEAIVEQTVTRAVYNKNRKEDRDEIRKNSEFRQRIKWIVTGAALGGATAGGGITAFIIRIFGL